MGFDHGTCRLLGEYFVSGPIYIVMQKKKMIQILIFLKKGFKIEQTFVKTSQTNSNG